MYQFHMWNFETMHYAADYAAMQTTRNQVI